ncbi:uncharacterized protein [Rutidosis leptorrhynchoides]|uniref:uncharacterized protein n=1 Tax=Rutidosis leptorrhynchoides TaxID=125765 RepID=UPI003A99EE8E
MMIPEESSSSSSILSESKLGFDSAKSLPPECPLHWRVDIDLLMSAGLYDKVDNILKQQYYLQPNANGDGTDNEFDEWMNLVFSDAPVSHELCHEFHSSFKLKENLEDMNDKEFMTFKLGGRPHQMSLEDFTMCLTIYYPEDLREQHVRDYIMSGTRVSDAINDGFDAINVWKKFSSSSSWSHHNGDVDFMSIDMDDDDDVEFRLIHMLLARCIFHRTKDLDKVYLSDLWYMEQIRSKTQVNIPYCVAYYLKHFAVTTGGDGQRIICGGHFVSLIARHLGLFEYDVQTVGNDKLYCGLITCGQYRKAKIISVSVFGKNVTRFTPGIDELPDDDDNDVHYDDISEVEEENPVSRKKKKKKKNYGGICKILMARIVDHEEVEVTKKIIEDYVQKNQLSKNQLAEIDEHFAQIESQLHSVRSTIRDLAGTSLAT